MTPDELERRIITALQSEDFVIVEGSGTYLDDMEAQQFATLVMDELTDLIAAARAVERVRGLAEGWRYKGEFGWGPWQVGGGPDETGEALDSAGRAILAALDGEQ